MRAKALGVGIDAGNSGEVPDPREDYKLYRRRKRSWVAVGCRSPLWLFFYHDESCAGCCARVVCGTNTRIK